MVKQPAALPAPDGLPFGVEFQKALLRLLLEDDVFCVAVVDHLRPEYFQNEVLAWAFAAALRHREQHRRMPSPLLLLELTRGLDSSVRPVYTAVLDQVRSASLTDAAWLREQTVEFARRCVFVRGFDESRALYNVGKATDAFDTMRKRMDELRNIAAKLPDRSWFFQELLQRQARRSSRDPWEDTFPTGLAMVDQVLEGGLSLGELGVWLAWPKMGKSTMLVNLGAACLELCFRNVLHFVLEGSRQLVENRYDACLMRWAYRSVKGGLEDMDAATFAAWQDFYRLMGERLVLRGFTDRWDYSILDLDAELRELDGRGWRPSMIIVDYGDLMRGHDGPYRSNFESQQAVYRALKSLATRGYAVWTATQATRPKSDDFDVKATILRSKDVADCYEKIRVADFIGSLNRTLEETKAGLMRVHSELYRENEAGTTAVLAADFATMRYRDTDQSSPSDPGARSAPPMGYRGGHQTSMGGGGVSL